MLAGIFEAALRSLMLAVLVWAGLKVFRVHNVVYQRLAWTAVLAGALLMPCLLPFTAHWASLSFATIPVPASLHHVQSAVTPEASISSPQSAPSTYAAFVPAPHYRRITPQVAIAETRRSSVQPDSWPVDHAPALNPAPSPTPARAQFSLVGVAVLTYFLVAAVLLVRLLYGLASALRLWCSSTPIGPGDAAPLCAGLNLRTSHKVSSPVTIGSGIVLPAGYTSWTEEKLRIVLAHEHAHVSQRDFHLLTLASLYAAVTWFSPLGWWLKHKLSDLGEAISDRSGLKAASSRSAYAQILLEFAASPRPTLIGVAMARPSNISRRIERLLNDNYLRHAFSGSGRARLAVFLVPVVLFAGAALVRVQAATEPAHAAPVFAPAAAGSNAVPAQASTQPVLAAQNSVPAAANSVVVLASPVATPQLAVVTTAQPQEIALATPPVLPVPAPPNPVPPAGLENGASQSEASFDRNLTFDGKLDLSVATGSGHITFTRGSANRIHIHGVVKTNRDGDPAKVQEIAANPPIEQAGNKITIGAHQERLHNISIDYDIEAPADAALNATTGSGNINDNGVGQGARLITGSGSITATGLEGGFKLQTGSGNISVDGNGQGDATVQTGSGNIDVKGVHGALKAQTGSGEIKVAGTPSSAWKLQTGSGSIELATGNAPMNLDATTGSGRISTEAPAQQTSSEEDHHHYRAQINGGGPEVSVVTGSGSIRVR
jgi:Zn-dependent protease with chaperone function